jgi:tetratricopeptide (TPR) repeat protein
MDCDVCLLKFNNSKKKPYVLYPCFHSFCDVCLNELKETKCPKCSVEIKDKQINWSLLKLITDDEIKEKCEAKLKENKTKINKINDQINKKYSEMVKHLQMNQKNLLKETSQIEKDLVDKLNKLKLKSDNVLNEIEEIKLNVEFKTINNFTNLIGQVIQNDNENVQQLSSDEIESKLNEAIKLDNNFKFEEALVQLNEITDSKPDLFQAQLTKGIINVKMENYEEAIDLFDSCLKKELTSSEQSLMFVNKGAALLGLEQYEESLEMLNKSIELGANDYLTFRYKGHVLGHLKQYEEAIYYLNKSIELNSQFILALEDKAGILTILMRLNEAIECYDQIIALDPSNYDAYCYKSKIFLELTDYFNSIECADKAIAINANNYECFLLKAHALFELKMFRKSLDSLSKVIELDPNNKDAYMIKGDCYFQLENYQEAIVNLDKTIELNDKNQINSELIHAYNIKALALGHLKKFNEAIYYHDRVLENCSESNLLKINLLKGCDLFELQQYEEAILNLDISIQNEPNEYLAYVIKGKCLMALKKYDLAIECFNQIEETPNNVYMSKSDAKKLINKCKMLKKKKKIKT